jgi:predicted Zn-dependent protease
LYRHPPGRPASPELQGVYDEVRASGAADDVLVEVEREHYLTVGIIDSDLNDLNSVAVVSYARMDPAYLGITPDEELLRSRLRKMIFKNIGMMYYSLPVSRDPRSVLYGNVLGLDDLDYMSEFFEPRS